MNKNVLTCLGLMFGVFVSLTVSAREYQSSNSGLVKHTVFFRYNSSTATNHSKLKEIRQKFLALKDKGLKNGKRYIVSIDAGISSGHEGAEQSMTDGYIITFRSTEDRDYYVGCDATYKCSEGGYKAYGISYDKAHDDFKSFVGPLLDNNGVFVFDFSAE